ncbi:biogenesis of lysosome-related organelles complex 1 subunit 2-like isoform X2 [Mercenaria mercenaria]|uniref:biogenesis of lysosome-related organelles complex 1 subunit 2-like isoform X2 n=1 Tax=Mercenaria mercenaria TaxID=6596 RepID=UPI00234E8637|nr:biogenesis of lysosome-related organelles complex 1 subunit 2-like isoform X2 [Mercenaria mercenaria]
MADKNQEVNSGRENTQESEGSVQKEQNEPPQDVVELCRETFKKTAEYLKGELEGTVEDYKLLETMNKVTVSKYSEMKNSAADIGTALQALNEKYRNLQPFLDQVDQIEDSVSSLEQAAYKLDAYSKRLEAKFKSLEKR